MTFFFPTVSARDRLSIQRGEVRGGVPRSQKREENPRAGLVKNHERRRGAGGDHGEPLHRAGTAMWGFPKSDTLFYLQRACDCSDRLPLPVVHKSSNTSPNTVTRKRLTVFVTNRRRLRATKAARRRCWNAWRSAPGRRRTRLEGQSIDELTLIGWTLTLTRLTKTK